MKRTTRQYITVALICIIIIGSAAIITSFIITKQIREEYEYQLGKLKQEKEDNQRIVYIAVNEIMCGDRITEDKLVINTVYSSQPQDSFITNEDIGKAALLNIPPGTPIMANMLTENNISSELREVEYDVIQISSNIITHDMVDVRVVFPNGEDFTILSKKAIIRLDVETYRCFLWLTEEEILRMQSAVIDAYLYTGAYLYTTKYIEPNIQEATIVNYEPSVEAISLILENPNIIQTATNELSKTARQALENRLTKSLHKDVTVKQWDLENDYIYQQYERPITPEVPEDTDPPVKESSTRDPSINDSITTDTQMGEELNVPVKGEKAANTLEQKEVDTNNTEFYSPELGNNSEASTFEDILKGLSKDDNKIPKVKNEHNQEYGNDIFIITEG